MKAITLYEPFASLMAIGAKKNETRPVRTNHRGDIRIHAAKKRPHYSWEVFRDASTEFEKRGIKDGQFQFGCIIAIVDLFDVQPAEHFTDATTNPNWKPGMICLNSEEIVFGDYTAGRWIYQTRNLRRLKTPIPCKGFQCIGWTVPEEIEKQIKSQL